jgi:hypothetical protein
MLDRAAVRDNLGATTQATSGRNVLGDDVGIGIGECHWKGLGERGWRKRRHSVDKVLESGWDEQS